MTKGNKTIGILLSTSLLYFLLVIWVILPLIGISDIGEGVTILMNSRRLMILLRTILYAFLVAGSTTLLGFFAAWAAYLNRRFLLPFFFIMILFISIPAYIHNLGWIELFSNVLNTPVVTGLGISALVQTLYFLPISAGIHYTGLVLTDKTYVQINLMNAKKTKAMLQSVYQLNRQYFAMAFLLVFMLCINEYFIPSVFAFITYPIEIMTLFSSGYSIGNATFAALPIILLSILSMIGLLKMLGGQSDSQGLALDQYLPKVGLNPIVLVLFFVIFSFQVVVPIFSTLLGLRDIGQLVDAISGSSNDYIFSFTSAFIAAFGMTCFSILLAYASQLSSKFRVIIRWALIIQFSLPGTIAGLGIIGYYQNFGGLFDFTGVPTIHLFFFRYLPIAYFILDMGFRQFSDDDIAVVRLESKRHLDLMRQLILPNLKPFLLISFLFTAILSLNELSGSIMTVPPGRTTITIVIYNYLHYGSSNVVVGLAMTNLILNLLLAGILFNWIKELKLI